MASEPISFSIPIHAPQVHYFLGTCEAHHLTYFSLGYENYFMMIIFERRLRRACVHVRFTLTVGGSLQGLRATRRRYFGGDCHGSAHRAHAYSSSSSCCCSRDLFCMFCY